MQRVSDAYDRINYLVGSADITVRLSDIPTMPSFDDRVINFLDKVSKILMKNVEATIYPDVVTFAFWIRRASLRQLEERFKEKKGLRVGKGLIFHIAPSNVPVNFAYSLAAGLLMGNVNIVRVPSLDFPQVRVITDALNRALEMDGMIKPYICCVRYDRDREINDLFSSIADERIVWGGDKTISELRKSPLQPRSGEVTFADRYSLAVIDSDFYMTIGNKIRVAEDFYNDTFLSDQNACTSPRLVAWIGTRIDEAKIIFWAELHKLAIQRYTIQPVQSINKLTKYCLAALKWNVKLEPHEDNLIIRIKVPEITEELMEYRDNSGFFYEYDCRDVLELVPLCNDKKCQTIGYIGDKGMLYSLTVAGLKGIDRVVPVGKTMDFDLIWDGYDLPAHLSRIIVLR